MPGWRRRWVPVLGSALLVATAAEAGRDFDDLVQVAMSHSDSLKGQIYEPSASRTYEADYRAAVEACLVEEDPSLVQYRFVLKIEASGGVSEIVAAPRPERLWCVEEAFEERTFPVPPFAPFRLLVIAANPAAKPPSTTHPKVELSEDERKQIFREAMAAKRRAEAEAERNYPDHPGSDERVALTNRLVEEYLSEVARKHDVTPAQLVDIRAEGFLKSWPVMPRATEVSPSPE